MYGPHIDPYFAVREEDLEVVPESFPLGPPVVVETYKTKVDRYDRMRQIAVSQHAAGKRPFKPSFYAAIMSHAGEFSPDLILLVELFTKKFDNLCKSDPRHDGISRARRTGDYRCRFKDALIATEISLSFHRIRVLDL